MTRGYYLCVLNSFFNKGTYTMICFYDPDEERFMIDNANVTKRVVKVLEKI